MKLTIVGGARPTPPSWSTGSRAVTCRSPSSTWSTRSGTAGPVAAMAQRMLARAGHPPNLSDLRPGRRRRRRGAVLLQLRVAAGHPAGRRDWPRVHCIGQETTGPGGFAKALRTVPWCCRSPTWCGRMPSRRPGSSTSPTRRIVTRALLEAATARSACAIRHRLPASFRRHPRRRAGRGLARPRGPQPPHLGAQRHRCRPGPLPGLLANGSATWRRGRTGPGGAGGTGHGSVLLPALLLRPRRGAQRANCMNRRGLRQSRRSRTSLLALYADPRSTPSGSSRAPGGAFYSERPSSCSLRPRSAGPARW